MASFIDGFEKILIYVMLSLEKTEGLDFLLQFALRFTTQIFSLVDKKVLVYLGDKMDEIAMQEWQYALQILEYAEGKEWKQRNHYYRNRV